MKRLSIPLLAAVAPALLLVVNALPRPLLVVANAYGQDVRLSQLRGMTVQDPNVQTVGKVKDFVVDTPSARLEYVIIGSGGVLGLGARDQALPVTSLSAATIQQGVLSTSITRQQMPSYPAFHGNVAALPALKQPTASGPSPTAALSPTARRASQPGRLELATSLVGTPVVNRQQQKLGVVSDLFLDVHQEKPTLAIIRTRKFLRSADTLAVPLTLLQRNAAEELQLDTSPQRLQQAPLFSERAWGNAARQGTATIYRVPGSNET